MAKMSSEYYQKILDVYERARHVIPLALVILEREYRPITFPIVQRCWRAHGLETVSMSDLAKDLIKKYAEECGRDPEGIAKKLVGEITNIDPEYRMSSENVRIQMKNIGILPSCKPRGIGGRRNCNSAGGIRVKIGKKPRKGYEFGQIPESI